MGQVVSHGLDQSKDEDNFAGGGPAASYFLLLRQEKVTKEKATLFAAPFGGSLRCSRVRAAAQHALANCARAQTVLADYPRPRCATRRLGRGGL